MPKVVYAGSDGVERVIDAAIGESVMSAALRNGVPGIIGECGGNTSCAHLPRLGARRVLVAVGRPAGYLEDDLLDLGGLRPAGRQPARLPDRADRRSSTGSSVDVPPEQSSDHRAQRVRTLSCERTDESLCSDQRSTSC